MEDQQSRPGDLTSTSPDDETRPAADAETAEAAEVAAAESPAAADVIDHPVTVGSIADAAAGTAPADTPGPLKRWSRRLRFAAVGLSAALFVGSAAFAGAAAQPYLIDRAVAATKMNLVRTATGAISTLWNYTPENMDTLADRASTYLSGDLEADYRKFIDTIAPANKHAKVTDTTEITGAAVESLNGPEATVLVYTNTSATSELTKNIPSLMYLSYRLFMKRQQNRWVITKMPTITSLNLTPQL